MELIYETLYKLRNIYCFNGYIHVKSIPGASRELVEKTGFLADRMSINLELPTAAGLRELAPGKTREKILCTYASGTAGDCFVRTSVRV